MTNAEIIASLAFAVSCASFIVAYLSFRRTTKLDEPNARAEVEPIAQENCWKVKVCLNNPTRYPLKIEALSVPIDRIPIDAKQDFVLSPTVEGLRPQTRESLIEAMKSGDPTGVYVKMHVSETTVAAESEGSVEAFIKRGAMSTASEARLTLHYWVMLERPRYRTLTLRARIPAGGISLHIART